MPYNRYNNYSFVVNNSFNPFTFDEMVKPLHEYRDAFKESEAAYADLSKGADIFKYLEQVAEKDPNSKAAQLYKGYADELHKYADDLSKNGLNMGNRRALTSLKNRYQGEIGRLEEADKALKKEQELRRAMNAKDSTMLYADENLSLDKFLDNATPDLYNVSGNDLYKSAADAGKAASSRIYYAGDAGSTLGGYYRDYVERMGYTPEQLSRFRDEIMNDFTAQVSVLPELQQAANSILESYGVIGKLSGQNLRKAQQQVIRGLVDGSVYKEDHKPVRDESRMSAAQEANYALQREGLDRQAAAQGLTYNKETKSFEYNAKKDPKYAKDAWKYKFDDNGQITGFSPEYEEAVKKGLIKGYDNDGNTNSGSKGGKEKPRKLKEARSYKQGQVFPITKTSSTTYGVPITYEQAYERDKNVALHDPGYEDYYEYFLDAYGRINIVPKPQQEQNQQASGQQTIEPIVPESDDNNQI